ncbi:putative inorganic phosphate cotransporter isoform X2 [Thrips palmi]|uniref:Putative inorganic phosphate cotransporter n=1 Tax=Thrips palmi TaxID=161013 RepID=A0A6P8YZ53_THRPL|nr:putative inorganic phosphate cotransporter isoform X2 [Thrips palmi]
MLCNMHRACQLVGARHVQAVIMFFSAAVAFCTRTNMSVAIVAMTKKTPGIDVTTFDWDPSRTSLVLSSFFWGYVVMNIPAGQLSQRFGPKRFLAMSVLVSSLFDLLMPMCAMYGDWPGVCAARVCQGLAQGFLLTACYELLSKWAPPRERSRMVSFFLAAQPFGIVVGLSASGALAGSPAGWPSIFYVTGALGMVVGIWILFGVSECPAQHPSMSEKERQYIEENFGVAPSSERKRVTPWLSIVTSIPMISLVLAHCGHSWAFWTILTKMPTYLDKALGYRIQDNGLLSALPYVIKYFVSFAFAWLADFLNNGHYISLTLNRKIGNSVGLWGPAIILVVLGFFQNDSNTCVLMLTLAVALNGATYVGYNINHLDLSPNYASTLFGITNAMANIMSFIAPLVVGAVVSDETNVSQWQTAFLIAAGVSFIGNLVFVIGGSAVRQAWDEPKKSNPAGDIHLAENGSKQTQTGTPTTVEAHA